MLIKLDCRSGCEVSAGGGRRAGTPLQSRPTQTWLRCPLLPALDVALRFPEAFLYFLPSPSLYIPTKRARLLTLLVAS